MKRAVGITLIAAGLLFVASCDDDDGPGQFRYPMRPGTEWYYTRSLTRVGDSGTFSDYNIETIVRVGPQVQVGTLGLATSLDITDEDGYFGSQFYQNREDGLFSVGHCGSAATVTPKRLSALIGNSQISKALEAADIVSFGNCDGRPIIGDDDTPLALPYPMRIGHDWLYREVEELSWVIRKANRGWDTVRVGAGKFDAYQIEWYYIGGPASVHIIDDVCALGLLRRTITIDSVEVRDLEHPGGTGEYETWIETLFLDSLKR